MGFPGVDPPIGDIGVFGISIQFSSGWTKSLGRMSSGSASSMEIGSDKSRDFSSEASPMDSCKKNNFNTFFELPHLHDGKVARVNEVDHFFRMVNDLPIGPFYVLKGNSNYRFAKSFIRSIHNSKYIRDSLKWRRILKSCAPKRSESTLRWGMASSTRRPLYSSGPSCSCSV